MLYLHFLNPVDAVRPKEAVSAHDAMQRRAGLELRGVRVEIRTAQGVIVTDRELRVAGIARVKAGIARVNLERILKLRAQLAGEKAALWKAKGDQIAIAKASIKLLQEQIVGLKAKHA